MGLTNPGKKESAEDHARRVREMFARISPRYDLLNHLLSGNMDRRWRRAVIRKLQPRLTTEAILLDIGCGTGDLSVALFEKTGAQVIGLDFCRPMLELAARKAPEVRLVEGDALQLPFGDCSFDAITIGFGLRNLSSVELGLNEMRRVLKPQGWVAILEFSRPMRPGFRVLSDLYCERLLPRIGGLISGSRSAYEYLPDSIAHFPDQQTLAAMMREVGFEEVAFENFTAGVAALHTGRRPA
jgi:demethylmenaquinone methyltransferase / 2-methoxy-6-polyprenyl-1,4-benzoquinol methylase